MGVIISYALGGVMSYASLHRAAIVLVGATRGDILCTLWGLMWVGHFMVPAIPCVRQQMPSQVLSLRCG
jgi:hypothetical protein